MELSPNIRILHLLLALASHTALALRPTQKAATLRNAQTVAHDPPQRVLLPNVATQTRGVALPPAASSPPPSSNRNSRALDARDSSPLFRLVWIAAASATALVFGLASLANAYKKWPTRLAELLVARDKSEAATGPAKEWHRLALAAVGLAIHGPPSSAIAPSDSYERLPVFARSVGGDETSRLASGDFGI